MRKATPNRNTAQELDAYWRREWNNYMAKPLRDDLFRQFLTRLPPAGWVLDLGSGPSRLSVVVQETDHRVLCLDLSSYVIERLLGERDVPGVVYDIDRWDGTRLFGTFAGVVCTEFLEHLEHPEKAVHLVAEHTSHALFTVPIAGHADECEMHVQGFSEKEFRGLLDAYWDDIHIWQTDKYLVGETWNL